MAQYTFRRGGVVLCIVAAFAGPASLVSARAPDSPQQAISAEMPGDSCLQVNFPVNRTNAKQRVDACSSAIQSPKLSASELALARLNRGTALMALGDTAMAGADYEEALKHYDSAIDPKEPNAMALYQRGAALQALGKTDRALSDYDEAIRLDPKYALAFYGRGILLATRKREYDRAIADFDKVLDLAPNNVDALIRRGDAAGQMGDFGRSIADLDRAVAVAPDNAQAYVIRGLTNGRRGKNELALTDYNAALQRDPGNVDALVNRAAIYATNGKNDLALPDLDAAIALRGNDPIAFYNRGYVHFANRAFDLAIADYSAAIALDPAMGLAYTNRCLTRAIVGRELVAALSDCDLALKALPDNPDVRETRGFVYLRLGDAALAIAEYDAALKPDSSRALALYGRGIARIRNGQRKEGEADQAAARALDASIERQFSMYDLN